MKTFSNNIKIIYNKKNQTNEKYICFSRAAISW